MRLRFVFVFVIGHLVQNKNKHLPELSVVIKMRQMKPMSRRDIMMTKWSLHWRESTLTDSNTKQSDNTVLSADKRPVASAGLSPTNSTSALLDEGVAFTPARGFYSSRHCCRPSSTRCFFAPQRLSYLPHLD